MCVSEVCKALVLLVCVSEVCKALVLLVCVSEVCKALVVLVCVRQWHRKCDLFSVYIYVHTYVHSLQGRAVYIHTLNVVSNTRIVV